VGEDVAVPFPLSESDLEDAERALDTRFPEPFRVRLLRENGGELETEDDSFELFRVLDTSGPVRQARSSARDIVHENESARLWPAFPCAALAIGDNGAGDYLVLLREGDRLLDSTFVWQHETGELVDVGLISDLLA
jgi:hypothetical protein